MQTNSTRRRFLAGSTTAGIVAVAGCLSETDGDESDDPNGDDADDHDGDDAEDTDDATDYADAEYEVWALDQGTDNIHIYEPGEGDAEFDLKTTVDLNELEGVPEEGVVPHMIDFSSDYEYAAIACTAGQRVLVFRTEGCELVGNVETGPGSHMAIFSPDDEYIHVDVIDEEAVARVDADLENESFEEVDRLELAEDETVQEAGIESANPICHQFDGQGRSLHTLGPSYHDAGVVIVDHDSFEVERAYSGDELPANCGTMPHFEDGKFYLTAGLPSDPDEGEDGVGKYYVYDVEEDEIIVDGESTEGVDAHGFWFTPDGEELWVLNRETNDGVIVDPETDEVVEEIEAFGPAQSDDPEDRDAPDIMWSSPDGEYMFVTLRGPVPLSGDPHAATGVTPGFSVLDIESREIVDVVEPDPIDDYEEEELQAARDEEDDAPAIPDFHGLGVRVFGDGDGEIPNSPPF
ncbi:YncE family protein [Natronococcus roseus]|uniref:YncE family protein n=1 Tax=Natronococcus roseus TaxID=1052014 RepID=UPI00374CD1F8